jgi:hypothetical protein
LSAFVLEGDIKARIGFGDAKEFGVRQKVDPFFDQCFFHDFGNVGSLILEDVWAPLYLNGFAADAV